MDQLSLESAVDFGLREYAAKYVLKVVEIECYSKLKDEKDKFSEVRKEGIEMLYEIQRFILDSSDGNPNERSRLYAAYDGYKKAEREKAKQKQNTAKKTDYNTLHYNC